MVGASRLPTVRPQQESVESTSLPPDVQGGHVCEQVVDPVTVRRILLSIPLFRGWELLEYTAFRFALIVNAVEADDTLEEDVQLRMARGILGDLKQRLEEVDHDLLKVFHQSTGLVDVKEPRNLDQPPDVWRKELVVNYPA